MRRHVLPTAPSPTVTHLMNFVAVVVVVVEDDDADAVVLVILQLPHKQLHWSETGLPLCSLRVSVTERVGLKFLCRGN